MTQPPPPKPILAFTDGASQGNPGPGGFGAILVFPNHHVVELGGAGGFTTNNRMELAATIAALQKLASHPNLVQVYTDSSYVLNGITQWIFNWMKRGWKTAENEPIQNQDLWMTLHGLDKKRGSKNISWHYVPGHAGIPGNERADEIAVAFAKGAHPSLFEGPLSKYGIPLLRLPKNTSVPKSNNAAWKNRATAPAKLATSYLSLVGNTPLRHSTWEECEKRVKGQSGARFKKTASPDEEVIVLEKWGFKKSDLK